ncbi:low-density lipoprotein receptor-related protein 2-like isoform X2 [Myzus persicae]|uniref:low-density lipoprotein receptor-related protein 2-like isoform X2 n=1 Tax=Myzus persicae TaxID=13164 RepID=UPI000B938C5D|nr:low-density lipoprotein receptor-related protein 2-like isoform X2 [Myzus persicae]
MVTRPTPDTAKSTHILAAALALLWLTAAGYSQDAVDTSLLYSQATSIKGKVLNTNSEEYNESIRPMLTSSMGYVSFDFDAHDRYIYYTEVLDDSVIYKIHINEMDREIVLSSEAERVVHLSVDWVTKNLYYIDAIEGTLNVLSTRNVTNKRVLLQNFRIGRPVLHPNKGYIFFSENGVSRVNMDGSNLINFKYPSSHFKKGLAVDFAMDRLYWCDEHDSVVYHSNLDLTDVISIKSKWINEPRLIATHKDWMYIINNSGSNSIIKLHKLTGVLADIEPIEVQGQDNGDAELYNLKIYSKHEQLIDNTHPCSMEANYGGCQKLCFAVPSNKSITSSLQAICGCLIGEKVDSDGKTCVGESKALTDLKAMTDSKATVDSKAVVDVNAEIESVSGGASRHIQYRYLTTVCFVLVYLFTI